MRTTAIHPHAAARGIASVHDTPLHRDVAALGWLATDAHGDREQLVLPIDLFLLSVLGDAGGELDITVSLLRERPARFVSRGGATLAFALLTPAGLMKVLRAPLHGLTDRRMALAAWCGAADVRGLRDALFAAPEPLQRTRQFGCWLEQRLHQRHGDRAAQARVADGAAWLQRQGGAYDARALSAALAVSQRQLERDFRLWLGVAPAAYARLVRFQRAARALADGARPADAACGHHYCDQSHLNRGFRELSALTPRQFAQLAREPRRCAEQRALAGRVYLLDAPGV